MSDSQTRNQSGEWPSETEAIAGFARILGLEASVYRPLINAGLSALAHLFRVPIYQLRPSDTFGKELNPPFWSEFDPFALVLEIESILGMHFSDDSTIQIGALRGTTLEKWMQKLTEAHFTDNEGKKVTWKQACGVRNKQ